jgi:hypothetical protein
MIVDFPEDDIGPAFAVALFEHHAKIAVTLATIP